MRPESPLQKVTSVLFIMASMINFSFLVSSTDSSDPILRESPFLHLSRQPKAIQLK